VTDATLGLDLRLPAPLVEIPEILTLWRRQAAQTTNGEIQMAGAVGALHRAIAADLMESLEMQAAGVLLADQTLVRHLTADRVRSGYHA